MQTLIDTILSKIFESAKRNSQEVLGRNWKKGMEIGLERRKEAI
jgi:hypothetical protein